MADTGLLTNTLLENKSPAERPVGGGFRGVCGWSGWRVGVLGGLWVEWLEGGSLRGVVGGVVGGWEFEGCCGRSGWRVGVLGGLWVEWLEGGSLRGVVGGVVGRWEFEGGCGWSGWRVGV